MKKTIKKILIANRGEIAVRIEKTCAELGIKVVAIFSESDRKSLHVRMANEAYFLEGNSLNKTYLNIEKIINIAKKSNVDAIHPGYGFLSENHLFAKRVREEGIIFIGPSEDTIYKMGLKTESRKIMKEAGLPVIPGSGIVKNIDELKNVAGEIGYPLIIKASAGGGGKGMRVVESEKELIPSYESCKREAINAFGNDDVYLEKYIKGVKHIEFQILADSYGNCVHLFERDCSIQRRHQKIIEETPSPALSDELREKMGDTAIKAGIACRYENAGTVEFILDSDDNFYFLEMNTRLQVEHPVTEMLTGLDLVEYQIRIAEGLNISNLRPNRRGHSIECRIYAEDPLNNFLPSPGKLDVFVRPSGLGIRNDSGVYEGSEISMDFDPMISKLIVWGENREKAIRRMLRALNDFVILGVKNNIEYLRNILSHDNYKSYNISTEFIDDFEPKLIENDEDMEIWALAASLILNQADNSKDEQIKCSNNWRKLGRLKGIVQ